MIAELKESISKSIQKRLLVLDEEERSLNKTYKSKMSIYNDGYYANVARNKALREAKNAQTRIDDVIEKKLNLLKELQSLD